MVRLIFCESGVSFGGKSDRNPLPPSAEVDWVGGEACGRLRKGSWDKSSPTGNEIDCI
ncbi:hypothetical protein SAMN05661012_02551 [Chitinophaga sancti]|uniref:Uncharacterized protein n=1 Tax=Chitinophaga sancti TaxID=1004 RepID=A0A1K1Q963_9BACT|nr:hypothetical protein SAMN05661012_02551 [Chitinophaga sancti]